MTRVSKAAVWAVLCSLWTSWSRCATCRGRCWCTEWVGLIHKRYHCADCLCIPQPSPLLSLGREHADLRPVLLCLLFLIVRILLLLSSTVLLQRWAPLLPLPLPAKVGQSTHNPTKHTPVLDPMFLFKGPTWCHHKTPWIWEADVY